ncbi:MAG: alpha/beta hydrolase [Bdellovibrionales bacterium]|nr:alpha/beta hydrolase [Bdellovibrionales bacterium]
MKKYFYPILIIFSYFTIVLLNLQSQRALAYDPCELQYSKNALAQNLCFEIPRAINSPYPEESSFILKGVLLTRDLSTKDEKDTIILIPGGPGSDGQAIQLSFNETDLLNALWYHNNLNVVFYDPRGTGKSQLMKTAEFYPPEVFSTYKQTVDLLYLANAVSPQKPVILLAHSAGGDIAAKFAAQYPDRVKGLILYSASIDTREVGESNLRLYSDNFIYWQNVLKTQCSREQARKFEDQRIEIETFLKNALKLVRIKNIRPDALAENFYPKDFRVELIRASENDPDCSKRIPETLNAWKERINALSTEIHQQVEAAAELRFNHRSMPPQIITRGTWIKTALICSEGITKSELESNMWLDGLKISEDICQGVKALYDTPPSRSWLKEIKSPTLLLGGTEDPLQIPSAVKRNAKAISGSQVYLFEGGGHESHLSHSWEFYSTITEFLNSI